MNVLVGLLRFVNGIVGSIGSLLLFLGIFSLAAKGDASWVVWGIIFMVLSEAAGLYLTKFEDRKQLDLFQATFYGALGSNFALPALIYGLFLLAPEKFTLVFGMALAAGAVIKAAAMVAKMMIVERMGA
jgi:hypothetical protein